MSDSGLTGIKENATGFVGRTSGLTKTKTGKPQVKFDIACGVNDPDNNRYPTWRHCVAYGKTAEKLADVNKGDLVKVFGWAKTEAVLDDDHHPVLTDGRAQLREFLILYTGEVVEYQKQDNAQMSMFAQF